MRWLSLGAWFVPCSLLAPAGVWAAGRAAKGIVHSSPGHAIETRAPAPLAPAAPLSLGLAEPYRVFQERESLNDHFLLVNPKTTISEEYRPAPGRAFEIPYVDIPVEELHVVDRGMGPPALRRHLYPQDGRFRFFLHPDSLDLYEKLIRLHGIAGAYNASPTASARTLLAWDPLDKIEDPVYVKLSLDRWQHGVNRVIPDWEIRRSVLVSELAAAIPAEDSERYGVEVIQDFAGAYVDQSLGAGTYVDNKQHTVFQHGMLYRDSSFIRRFPGLELYPLFAPFAGRAGQEPLLIEWWRAAGGSFEDFLEHSLIEPFLLSTAYLLFEQGILPDAHGQNMVVGVDPATRRARRVLHRDAGAMKVDYLMRWSKGRPTASLRGANAAYDFKPRWSAEIAAKTVFTWFYKHLFTGWRNHDQSLKPYVPGYDPEKILSRVQVQLAAALKRHIPLPVRLDPADLTQKTLQAYIEDYLRSNPPRLSPVEHLHSSEEVARFVSRQTRFGQIVPLPDSWLAERPDAAEPLLTEHGVVHRAEGAPALALVPKEGLSEGPDEKPVHYTEVVALDQITLPRAWEEALEAAERAPAFELPAAIPVIKTGAPGSVRYRLVANFRKYQKLRARGAKDFPVLVIQDVSALPEATQAAILAEAYRLQPKD